MAEFFTFPLVPLTETLKPGAVEVMTDLQLAAWKAILDPRRDAIGQPSERPALVRRCFEDLDASGFTWTRDAIEDAILRIETSRSIPDNGDADKVGKKCDPVTLYACEPIKDPCTRSAGLLDLPIEVLDKIVKLARGLASSERHALDARKEARFVEIRKSAQSGSHDVCLHGQEPILNTFQALASVNRSLHNFCIPSLWEV